MKIIVGLGNPTKEYAGTRHNVGFSVIYNISDVYNIPVETKKHKALIGKGIIEGEKVILAMPQTYMNLSGESVRELMDYYKCDLSDLIVIWMSESYASVRRAVPVDTMASRISLRSLAHRSLHESRSVSEKSRRRWIWRIMCLDGSQKKNSQSSGRAQTAQERQLQKSLRMMWPLP